MAEIDNDFQIELFGGLDISKSKSNIDKNRCKCFKKPRKTIKQPKYKIK